MVIVIDVKDERLAQYYKRLGFYPYQWRIEVGLFGQSNLIMYQF